MQNHYVSLKIRHRACTLLAWLSGRSLPSPSLPAFPSTNYLVYNIGGPGNPAFRFMHPYRTETDSGRFVEFRALVLFRVVNACTPPSGVSESCWTCIGMWLSASSSQKIVSKSLYPSILAFLGPPKQWFCKGGVSKINIFTFLIFSSNQNRFFFMNFGLLGASLEPPEAIKIGWYGLPRRVKKLPDAMLSRT